GPRSGNGRQLDSLAGGLLRGRCFDGGVRFDFAILFDILSGGIGGRLDGLCQHLSGDRSDELAGQTALRIDQVGGRQPARLGEVRVSTQPVVYLTGCFSRKDRRSSSPISSKARPITVTSSRDWSNSSRSGISARQGEHQVAQKLTTTQSPRWLARSQSVPSTVWMRSVGRSAVSVTTAAAVAETASSAAAISRERSEIALHGRDWCGVMRLP